MAITPLRTAALSTPDQTNAIAEALWGIAAAITESRPEAPKLTRNTPGADVEEARIFTPGLREAIATAGTTKTYGPTANPDAFRPALELLPIRAVAELDEPVVLDGPKAKGYGIPSGVKISRVEKHRHELAPGRGSGFELHDGGGIPWLGNTDIVLEMGLSARDFSLPEADLQPYVEKIREAASAFAAETEDVVNKPSHYRQEDGLECIDFNYDLAGPWFSVVRYVWRCMDKGNPVQDLEKALRYIQIADEKGLEKPRNAERCETFRGLWLRENDDAVAEQRYYVLARIFDDRPSISSETVHRHIERLLDLIKENA